MVKKACLIILEYNILNIEINKKNTALRPYQLQFMTMDIIRSAQLGTEIFNIEPKNITIITDITPGRINSITVKRDSPESNRSIINPETVNWIQLPWADIELTIKSILNFFYQLDNDDEVFFYYSGHGTVLTKKEEKIDCLVLAGFEGDNYIKKYLPTKDFFDLIFGKGLGNKIKILSVNNGKLRIEYYNIENLNFNKFKSILLVFDCCCSGGLSGFKYEYDSKILDMISNFNNELLSLFDGVALSASDRKSRIPSNLSGSVFTRCLRETFSKLQSKVSIKNFHQELYKRIPKALRQSNPTICSVKSDPNQLIPLF